MIGFDVNVERIAELKCDHDATLEVSEAELRKATKLAFSNDPEDLAQAGDLHRHRADPDRLGPPPRPVGDQGGLEDGGRGDEDGRGGDL